MGRFSDVFFIGDDTASKQLHYPTNLDAIAYFEGGRHLYHCNRPVAASVSPAGGDFHLRCRFFCNQACYDFGAQKLEFCIAIPTSCHRLWVKSCADTQSCGRRCMDARFCFGRDALRDEYVPKAASQSTTAVGQLPTLWVKASFYAPFHKAGHCFPGRRPRRKTACFPSCASGSMKDTRAPILRPRLCRG